MIEDRLINSIEMHANNNQKQLSGPSNDNCWLYRRSKARSCNDSDEETFANEFRRFYHRFERIS